MYILPKNNGQKTNVRKMTNTRSFKKNSTRNDTDRACLFIAEKVQYTKKAGELLSKLEENPAVYLERHEAGDWGLVSEFEYKKNEKSLRENSQIVSIYQVSSGEQVMLITDLELSVSTFLVPEEYNGNYQDPICQPSSLRIWYWIHYE